jgi:adenine-specific DNA-methyltransferase
MIKYLGSKRVLVPLLVDLVRKLPGDVRTFVDLFSGTCRVGHAMKRAGYQVTANDHNAYAHALAGCYVQADADAVLAPARRLLAELQSLPPRPGYVTETYCQKSRFFHPKNGERIDAIRERIEELDLEPDLRAVVLVSLMEAADRVDSTTGVQMAYLKSWAPRAHNDLELRVPDVLPGPGRALKAEAIDALHETSADVIYIDPPYNQHSYLGNYHIWETLVAWDRPKVYGVACKRVDCRARTSPFNSKRQIHDAMRELLVAAKARHLLVSLSSEGYITPEQMRQMLEEHGDIEVHTVEYDRYVGARIGIYNPKGEKVGRIGHLKNHEHVFVVRYARAP